MENEKRNAEGYWDPTAATAIENVSRGGIKRGDTLWIHGDKFDGEVVVLIVREDNPYMLTVPIYRNDDPRVIYRAGDVKLSGTTEADTRNFVTVHKSRTAYEYSGGLEAGDYETVQKAVAELLGFETEKPLTAKVKEYMGAAPFIIPKETNTELELAKQAARIWEKAFFAVCGKEKTNE